MVASPRNQPTHIKYRIFLRAAFRATLLFLHCESPPCRHQIVLGQLVVVRTSQQLRYMSKQELFSPSLSRWVLEHVGSIPVDRADPSPSSIKTAVDIPKHGGVILIFPSGTRSDENIVFRRGAATVALHARVALVPAFFQGPKADASCASPAPTSNPGDIRVTDPDSGSTVWEGNDD